MERYLNFKMQVFIYSYEKHVARSFLFHFNKICNRFKIVTTFSCLTLHAINLLLWKKILSLNLFKIITVGRSTTLIKVLLMGRSGCRTKGRDSKGGSLKTQKFEISPSVEYHPHQKIEFLCSSPDHRPHIGKKGYL